MENSYDFLFFPTCGLIAGLLYIYELYVETAKKYIFINESFSFRYAIKSFWDDVSLLVIQSQLNIGPFKQDRGTKKVHNLFFILKLHPHGCCNPDFTENLKWTKK